MNQYLYQYLEPLRPGLLEREWTEEENAIYEAHVAHLKKGAEESIVILAGRCQDGIGPAIVIIETSTEYEAHRFMDNDPFVRDGLFRASIHPYRVAIARTPF